MKFDPKTEKEVNEMGLLPVGVYDFAVITAEDKQSQKGNDMAVVKLRVEDTEGREFAVVDYLVAIDSMAYKLRHFAAATGLLAEYEKGEMPAEVMEGRTGKCKIGIQPAKGEYRAKNVVQDYLAGDAATAESKTEPLVDDEIPF